MISVCLTLSCSFFLLFFLQSDRETINLTVHVLFKLYRSCVIIGDSDHLEHTHYCPSQKKQHDLQKITQTAWLQGNGDKIRGAPKDKRAWLRWNKGKQILFCLQIDTLQSWLKDWQHKNENWSKVILLWIYSAFSWKKLVCGWCMA